MPISPIREMHTMLGQLNEVRKSYLKGKLADNVAKNAIGLFNSTSRAVDITLRVEKWNKVKNKRQK